VYHGVLESPVSPDLAPQIKLVISSQALADAAANALQKTSDLIRSEAKEHSQIMRVFEREDPDYIAW
jgi:hypothetical protein